MTEPVHYDTLREALRRFDFRTPTTTPAWRRKLPLRTRLRMIASAMTKAVLTEGIVTLVGGLFLYWGLAAAHNADARVPDLAYWACFWIVFGVRSFMPGKREGTS